MASPGMEPGSPRCNAGSLTTAPPRPRAFQKQSSDTHETPYDRVKRCRERKINIKASERVNGRSGGNGHTERESRENVVAVAHGPHAVRRRACHSACARVMLALGGGTAATRPATADASGCRATPAMGAAHPTGRRYTVSRVERHATVDLSVRVSQKQSSDTHKTSYDRAKRCRERKKYIKASERVNVDLFFNGATVAEQLVCSPLTKVIRAQSPARSSRMFACENRAGRCRWSAGCLWDLPFPPPFHSDATPYSPQSPSSALKTSILRATTYRRRHRLVSYLNKQDKHNEETRTNTVGFSEQTDCDVSGTAICSRLQAATHRVREHKCRLWGKNAAMRPMFEFLLVNIRRGAGGVRLKADNQTTGFLGDLSRPFNPVLLHAHITSPSPALKTSILRAAQTSSPAHLLKAGPLKKQLSSPRCMARRISRQSQASRLGGTPLRRRRQGLDVICEETAGERRVAARRSRQLIPRARLQRRSFAEDRCCPRTYRPRMPSEPAAASFKWGINWRKAFSLASTRRSGILFARLGSLPLRSPVRPLLTSPPLVHHNRIHDPVVAHLALLCHALLSPEDFLSNLIAALVVPRDVKPFPPYTLHNTPRPSNLQDTSEVDAAGDVSPCEELFLEVPPEFRDNSETASVASEFSAHEEYSDGSPGVVVVTSTHRPPPDLAARTLETGFNNRKSVSTARNRRCAEQLTNQLKQINDGKYLHEFTDDDQSCRGENGETQIDPATLSFTTHFCDDTEVSGHDFRRNHGTFTKRTLSSYKTDVGPPETRKDRASYGHLNGQWKGIVARKSTERKKSYRSNFINFEMKKCPEELKEISCSDGFSNSVPKSNNVAPEMMGLKYYGKDTFKKSALLKLAVTAENLNNKCQQVRETSLEGKHDVGSDRELSSKTKRQKNVATEVSSCFRDVGTNKVYSRPANTHEEACKCTKVQLDETVTCKSCVLTGQTDDDKIKRSGVFCNEALTKFKNVQTHEPSGVTLQKMNAVPFSGRLSEDVKRKEPMCYGSKEDPHGRIRYNNLDSCKISKNISASENVVDESTSKQSFVNNGISTDDEFAYRNTHVPFSCKIMDSANTAKTRQSNALKDCNSSIENKNLSSGKGTTKNNVDEKRCFKTLSARASRKHKRVFEKYSLSNEDESFCGLLQYLHDNKHGLSEILAKNNVIIEPLQEESDLMRRNPDKGMITSSTPKAAETDKPCRITGATIKNTAGNTDKTVSSSTNSLPKQHSQRPALRRHYFYYPTRTNRELVDEELPQPDKVRIMRQLFENPAFVSANNESDDQEKPNTQGCELRMQNEPYCRTKSIQRFTTSDSELSEVKQTTLQNVSVSLEDLSTCINGGGISSETEMSNVRDSDRVGDNLSADTEQTSTAKDDEDDTEESVRYVTPEVLEKIRACGTSVTYYGGHVISCSRGTLMRPMTTAIMDEIRQNNAIEKSDTEEQGFVLKFRLVKSNSCGSRIELAGAEEHDRCNREMKGISENLREEVTVPSRIKVDSSPTTESSCTEKSPISLCSLNSGYVGKPTPIANNEYESLHKIENSQHTEDTFNTSICRELHNSCKSNISKTFIEERYDLKKCEASDGFINPHVGLLHKPVMKSCMFNDMEFEEFEVLEGNFSTRYEVEKQRRDENTASQSVTAKTVHDNVNKSTRLQLSEDCGIDSTAIDDHKRSKNEEPMSGNVPSPCYNHFKSKRLVAAAVQEPRTEVNTWYEIGWTQRLYPLEVVTVVSCCSCKTSQTMLGATPTARAIVRVLTDGFCST
ncbi:hypothetical protein PR048_003238 [Dryococelus australis]|uniref:Uncharacterized protein n=1 Tax=Dryococelus australis TaxID=614101 RepID=A0ABQ9IMK0_9NEOP|nr:hypothetical protein PR048_003238 [Dryococelus australis]